MTVYAHQMVREEWLENRVEMRLFADCKGAHKVSGAVRRRFESCRACPPAPTVHITPSLLRRSGRTGTRSESYPNGPMFCMLRQWPPDIPTRLPSASTVAGKGTDRGWEKAGPYLEEDGRSVLAALVGCASERGGLEGGRLLMKPSDNRPRGLQVVGVSPY